MAVCPILHSYQWCNRTPGDVHHHQHLVLSIYMFFYFSHPNCYVLVSHPGFNLHFVKANYVEYLFMCLFGSHTFSLNQIFCPFLIEWMIPTLSKCCKIILSSMNCSSTLVKNQLAIFRSISWLSILFDWSLCLPLSQYHIAFC